MQAGIYPEVPDDFGNWLAGFTDGEGCFSIDTQSGRNIYYTRFQLRLRLDDRPILDEICRRTGLGSVYRWPPDSAAASRTPIAVWTVYGKRDCAALVALFERFPLRAKKLRDFTLWADAVRLMGHDRRDGRRQRSDWEPLTRLKEELRTGRQFVPTVDTAPADLAPSRQELFPA